jgi:hypothetical protein
MTPHAEARLDPVAACDARTSREKCGLEMGTNHIEHALRAFRPVLAVLCLLLSSVAGQAAELLMFEQPGCPWCRKWHAEVGPAYGKSAEGQIAPLRRLQLGDRPTSVVLKQPVTVTPTFVLVEHGSEVGRITGYPGAEFFYGLLAPLLEAAATSR